MYKRTKIVATLGNRDRDPRKLQALAEAGVDVFRVLLDSPRDAARLEATAAVVDRIRALENTLARPLGILAELPDDPQAATPGGDPELVAWCAQRELDFVGVPVRRGVVGIERTREILRRHPARVDVVARLEDAASIREIDAIAQSADAVALTSGALDELAYWEAPIAQKSVARQCQIAAKPCILARDLLPQMARGGVPERAELFDLSNAVFDHVDAVQLAASDGFPLETVQCAGQTLLAAEGYLEVTDRPLKVGFGQPPNTALLAYAIRHILKLQEIAAVAVYSVSGSTAALIAKNWIDCPVLAFSADPGTARRMCLLHGVVSRWVPKPLDAEGLLATAGDLAKQLELASPGDRIIVVSGHPIQTQDRANGFVVEEVR